MDEWIIHSIIAGAAVLALWFTANSFRRLRKTEQIRLSESILKDIRNSIKDYDIISSDKATNPDEVKTRLRKLERYLDNACETLNWYCKLIEIGEINDKRLLEYFKRIVVKWNDDFFLKHVGVDIISNGRYPSLTRVYLRYQREEEESKVTEPIIPSKHFGAPKLVFTALTL